MYSWFQNLINLKNIFDKYLPMVREVYSWVTTHKDDLRELQLQIKKLKEIIEELKKSIPDKAVVEVEQPLVIEEEQSAVPTDEVVIDDDATDKIDE